MVSAFPPSLLAGCLLHRAVPFFWPTLTYLAPGFVDRLVVNAVQYQADARPCQTHVPACPAHPPAPRSYGISQTMDQVFTAPLIVKHVLCAEHGINESYIGGRDARVRSCPAGTAGHRPPPRAHSPTAGAAGPTPCALACRRLTLICRFLPEACMGS